MTGTIAITMAGMGSRFAKAGYDRPKYEIMANGISLFDWSMYSLEAFRQAGWTFHFIARSGRGAPEFIHQRAKALGFKDVVIETVDALTDGQATTALCAAKQAAPALPFAIYNIDTFVAPHAMTPPAPDSCAGWIPCFPAPGEGWSFVRTDAAGRALEVREKQRISDNATVGLYWFDSAARYVSLYEDYYSVAGREEKGERYVAPLYNELIAVGQDVRIATLSMNDVGMLGTPDQVAAFIQSPPAAARAVVASGKR